VSAFCAFGILILRPFERLLYATNAPTNNNSSSAHHQHTESDPTASTSITYFAGGDTPSSTGISCAKISTDWRQSSATTESTMYELGLQRSHNKPSSDNDINHRHLVMSRYGSVTWQQPMTVIGQCLAASEQSREHFEDVVNLWAKYWHQATTKCVSDAEFSSRIL